MLEDTKDDNESKQSGKSLDRRKVLQAIAVGTTGLAGASGIGSARGPPGGQIDDFKYRFLGCREVYVNKPTHASIRVKDGEDCIWRGDWQRTTRNNLDWDSIYSIKVDKHQQISYLCHNKHFFVDSPNGCSNNHCSGSGCR